MKRNKHVASFLDINDDGHYVPLVPNKDPPKQRRVKNGMVTQSSEKTRRGVTMNKGRIIKTGE